MAETTNVIQYGSRTFSEIREDLIALIKQTGTDDMYLFVNENNIAVKKPVKTGRIIDDQTEIVEGIKNIEYSYTNYPTQMSSRKNYDRGNMAREICSAIIKELTQTKPN